MCCVLWEDYCYSACCGGFGSDAAPCSCVIPKPKDKFPSPYTPTCHGGEGAGSIRGIQTGIWERGTLGAHASLATSECGSGGSPSESPRFSVDADGQPAPGPPGGASEQALERAAPLRLRCPAARVHSAPGLQGPHLSQAIQDQASVLCASRLFSKFGEFPIHLLSVNYIMSNKTLPPPLCKLSHFRVNIFPSTKFFISDELHGHLFPSRVNTVRVSETQGRCALHALRGPSSL